MKKRKLEKGITLIALIIIIVVLLILAVVTIGTVKDSRIIGHTQNAATKYNDKKAEELSILSDYEKYILGIQQEYKKDINGSYIVANDVNSKQHDLEIKLTSDTITDFSSVSVSRYGSNLLDVSKMLNSNLIDNNDGTYNFNFTGSQKSAYYDIFIPAGVPVMANINTIENTLSKNFKLQLIFEDNSKDYISLYDGATWGGYSKCIIYQKNIIKVAFLVVSGAQSGEYIKFSEPKLNIGSIQPYEDFKEVETITSNSNGGVEGLKSISPNMTIITNNSDVKIDCKYILQSVKYNLYGKNIVNFGDSIFGNYSFPNDISSYMANFTNATVYNVGFGGCCMSSHPVANYDAFSMYRLADAIKNNNWELQDTASSNLNSTKFIEKLATLKSIDFSKVDIITIAYGTNDFMNSVNKVDFKNALKDSIEKISNAYPNIEIVLCTPIYRFWVGENGEFLYDSDTYQKLSGQKLTDYVQWIKEVASEYNLFVIDNYNNCGINSQNRTQYFSTTDGTHPNAAGRKLIAENMAKELYERFK